jgi:hypothetical protein
MILDENNYVQWSALSEYTTFSESLDWYKTYKEGLTPEVIERVEAWLRDKERYEALRDQGKIEITVTTRSLDNA